MIGSDGRETYRVVWPRGAKTVQATDVAPRLGTLDGKVIGQLWDDLFRGDEIFPIIEEAQISLFGNHKPANVVVGVAIMSPGYLIEVDAIAVIDEAIRS